MADTNNRKINIWINGQQVTNSVRDIRNGMRKLIAEQAKMTIGSDEYVAHAKKIGQLDGIIKEHRKTLSGVSSGWANVKKSILAVAGGNLLSGGISGAFQKIVSAVKGAMTIINNFGKATSKLQGILGITKDEMTPLITQAKELGASTAFTASQVLELDTEFAKLGFPSEDIQKMAESTLNAAAAMGSELGEQAALTGAVLRSFNKDANEAARVNDILAEATNRTALDFKDLQTGLPIVSATASTAGVDLERLTALLGTLADRGIDASTAATSLRNIFLKLAQDGKTWDQAMNEINNSTNKNATAMELFDVRASTAANILAITSNEAAEGKIKFDDLERSLRNADGAAASLAETMLDNLAGDMTKAQSAWEGFVLSIEDGSGPISKTLRGIVTMVTDLLTVLTKINNGESFQLQVMKKAHDFQSQMKSSTEKLTYQLDLKARALDELNNSLMKVRRQQSAWRGDPEKTKELEAQRAELERQIEAVKKKNWAEETGAKMNNELLARKKKLSENLRLLDEEEAKTFKDNDKILQIEYANEKLKEEIKHIEKLKGLEEDVSKTKTTPELPKVTATSKTPKDDDKAEKELERRYDKFVKAYETYQEKLQDFQDKYYTDGLDKQTKEREDLKQHWDEVLNTQEISIIALEELGKGRTAKETALLKDLKNQHLNLLEQRGKEELALLNRQAEEKLKAQKETDKAYEDARKEASDRIADAVMSDKDLEIEETYNKYQELIALAKEYGFDTVELYQAMKEALAAIDEEFASDDKDKRDPVFNLTDDEWGEFYDKLDGVMSYASAMGDAWGAYHELRRQQDNEELARIDQIHDQKKAALDAQLAGGIISEKKYNERVAQIDAEADKKRKKIEHDQAQREKRLKLFEAIIGTAASVAKVAWSIPLAILTAAAGALQIAAIASAPVPQLAKGGRVNGPTLAVIGEKGEEIVFSNQMITDPETGPLLNQLADIQEGKRPRLGSYARPNFAGMSEAIGRSKVQSQASTQNTAAPEATRRIDEMVNESKMLNEKFDKMLKVWQDPKFRIKSYLVNDEFKTFQEDEEIGKALADI